jgi:multicomponent Na+:H+ antiporter subunit G
MQEILSMTMMILGAILMFLAALGILRFPDLYMRISAATKASTLGVSCCLVSLAIHFNELGIISRSLATIAFVAITSPVAAHLISRSAYLTGTPLWKESVTDELKDKIKKLDTSPEESNRE